MEKSISPQIFQVLSNEWHPTKNGVLRLSRMTKGSHKKVWWICPKGHEYEAQFCNRAQGTGCPFCSGNKVGLANCLATVSPDIAREWHPTRNTPLKATDITQKSYRRIWWRCSEGHEWHSTPNWPNAKDRDVCRKFDLKFLFSKWFP